MIRYGKFTCMNQKAKKKLCWNCEGSVSLSEESCPYCGVTAIPAFLEGAAAEFAPPYSATSTSDFDVPKSPYSFKEKEEAQTKQLPNQIDQDEPDDFKYTILSITFLLCGSAFFLFSLALGLFSQNGIFTLHWDANYWFIYTILAIPLLFIGWRYLMKLNA